MKAIIFTVMLFLGTVISAQQFPPRLDPVFSVNFGEEVSNPTFTDLDGDGSPELCVRVWGDYESRSSHLVFFDLKLRRKLGHIPMTNRVATLLSADLEGDGREEIIFSPSLVYKDGIGIVVFRWTLGQIVRTDFNSFYGELIRVGDINGDGNDELVLFHLPKGYTNPGGTGPTDIQILSWNGTDFELIAQASFPQTNFQPYVGDLDGDGRAEIVILKSGARGDPVMVGLLPELSVYSYTDNPRLTLLTEHMIDTENLGSMDRIWGLPIEGGKQQLIIPIRRGANANLAHVKILDYRGFQLEGQQLIRESEPLQFSDSERRYLGSMPLFLYPKFKVSDIDNDGQIELLQIANRRQVQFVKLPHSIPSLR